MKLVALFMFLLRSKLAWGAAESCQSWAPTDWDRYLNSTLLDSYILQKYPAVIHLKLAEQTAACPKQVQELGLSKCLDRISGFTRHFLRKGGMFSSLMSDQEYYASQPQEIMELPTELKESAHGLPQNWRQLAAKNGWKYVLFRSNTSFSTEGQNRLILRLPGEKYDRLLLYFSEEKANSDPTTYRGLQMQAIEHNPSGANGMARYYFRSWNFTGPGATPRVSVSGGRCVSCHINGPRAIVPKGNPEFATELGGVSTLREFNRLLTPKKALDYSPYYDLKNFPVDMPLGASHSCLECHNSYDRKSLAFSVNDDSRADSRIFEIFNLENLHRKVRLEKTMPAFDGETLSDDDRYKLVYSLRDEYYTLLKAWLTETKCSTNP